MSKEAAKSGGLELAKEVPAPIASIVALGGFAAWWVLSSTRGHKGPKATVWQKRITLQAKASSTRREAGADSSFEKADEESETNDGDDDEYVIVDDPDEISESGQASNSSATEPLPSDEEVLESAKKAIAQAQEGRRLRAGQNHEDPKKEEFFNAIMQGDIQFVKAAFDPDSLLWPDLSPESCDDYGNTLLILATQVWLIRSSLDKPTLGQFGPRRFRQQNGDRI